ncbi:MAG: SDR family NAD(P)-dependent oxidoreductase [Thermoguttaceae bacterium]|nr:SDR family NAD(P)-dependent oxidoreductase [Thermoguttaceae bacterium]
MSDTKERLVAAISGATSGFGLIYARRFAEKGFDLFLIARREEILQSIQKEYSAKYGVHVEYMVADLAVEEDLKRVESRLEKIDRLAWMINSAGFGGNRAFPDVDVELESRMVLVHCLATMRLSHAATVPMARRKYGRIVNIASAAGFLAGDHCAEYCSTKAYIITFSKCLQCDVSRYGIRVQALCPGFVRTGFHDTYTMRNSQIKEKVPGFLWTPAEYVVRCSLRAIERKLFYRVILVPSLRYKIIIWAGSVWWLSPLRMLFTGGKVR